MARIRHLTRSFLVFGAYLIMMGIALPQGWFEVVVAHAQGEVVYDFESSDVGDWITQGQVTVVAASIDPQTYNSLQTVAQGDFSVRIGDEVAWAYGGDQVSAIEREVIVPSTDAPVLQFSYAVVANDPPNHDLHDKPNFRLEVVDLTTGETLPVSDFKYSSQSNDAWYVGGMPGSDFSQSSFHRVNRDRWVFIPWRHEKVDLSGRAGHRLRMSFILSDCNPSAHAAYGYFDNIRIGSEVVPPPLPPLVGTEPPPLAGVPIDPGALATFLTWVEQNKIWPLVACLTPLLLLFFLGFGGYGVVQATRPKRSNTTTYEEPMVGRRPTNPGAQATIREEGTSQSNEEAGATINPNKPRRPKGPWTP